jgi:hypothetical protein
MNRTAIEKKLNEAMERQSSAQREEWSLSSDIEYHDRRASEIRKTRQKVRSKKDRADAAIKKYSVLLEQAI